MCRAIGHGIENTDPVLPCPPGDLKSRTYVIILHSLISPYSALARHRGAWLNTIPPAMQRARQRTHGYDPEKILSLYVYVMKRSLRSKLGPSRSFPSGGPSAPGRRFPPEAPAEGCGAGKTWGPGRRYAPPPQILRLRRGLCCWPAAKQGACGGEAKVLAFGSVAVGRSAQPGEWPGRTEWAGELREKHDD